MKLKGLLMVNAVVFGASGLCALLFPEAVLSLYGVISGPEVMLMSQYAGMGSITIGLLAWLARNVKDVKAQRAIILSLLITYIIGVIVSVLGTISGLMKIGWAVVGLYLVFASAYGYFLAFSKKSESISQESQ
jgi:tetrahydromethanopterin S-methyltransferase subunit C